MTPNKDNKKNNNNNVLLTLLISCLQGLVDDSGGAGRARGVVVQLLLQGPQQAAEVRGRVVGARAAVLDGAEGLREQTQLPEALLQQALGRLQGFV